MLTCLYDLLFNLITRWGIALITLGELENAKSHLLKAKKQLPADRAVTDAWEKVMYHNYKVAIWRQIPLISYSYFHFVFLSQLERKMKHEKEEESRFWKRAVNPGAPVEEKV